MIGVPFLLIGIPVAQEKSFKKKLGQEKVAWERKAYLEKAKRVSIKYVRVCMCERQEKIGHLILVIQNS